MALIAWEVRCLRAAFCGEKQVPPLEDYLPKFPNPYGDPAEKPKEGGETIKLAPLPAVPEAGGNFDKGEAFDKGVEVGQPLDLKWKEANIKAKMTWFSFVPPECRETEVNGGDEPGT